MHMPSAHLVLYIHVQMVSLLEKTCVLFSLAVFDSLQVVGGILHFVVAICQPSNHKPATENPGGLVPWLQVAGQFHYLSDIEERLRPQGKAKVLNMPHQPGWAEDSYEGVIHVRQPPLEVL